MEDYEAITLQRYLDRIAPNRSDAIKCVDWMGIAPDIAWLFFYNNESNKSTTQTKARYFFSYLMTRPKKGPLEIEPHTELTDADVRAIKQLAAFVKLKGWSKQ